MLTGEENYQEIHTHTSTCNIIGTCFIKVFEACCSVFNNWKLFSGYTSSTKGIDQPQIAGSLKKGWKKYNKVAGVQWKILNNLENYNKKYRKKKSEHGYGSHVGSKTS